jgi:hypothetical protein
MAASKQKQGSLGCIAAPEAAVKSFIQRSVAPCFSMSTASDVYTHVRGRYGEFYGLDCRFTVWLTDTKIGAITHRAVHRECVWQGVCHEPHTAILGSSLFGMD